LGDIVFVPEAGPKSGSLITVDFAIQFGKKVFACPGNIFQLSSYGINQYIAEKKVNLVYDLKKFVEDILGKPQEVKQDDLDLPEEDKIILAHIKEGINTVDKLALYTKQDINQILTKLTMLEMK
jgi:DNA processing protein